MTKTTVQINNETLERLKRLKVFNKQSYDDILNKLIDNFDEETLDEKEIMEIKEGLDDIKNGRTYSIESVAKELGVNLE